MRTYADPHTCPDCGAPLPAGSSRCQACGLDLGGPLGQELFATLVRADGLLARMRLASRTPVTVSAPGPVTAPPAGVATGPAPEPGAPPLPRTPALRGASVPKILLTLGALCLLVAAIVFLVVTWSVMGVGGRTATLVVLTLTTGALTWWAATKDLRGAVEALGTVTLGLFALDVLGARNAGWLGDPSGPTFQVVLGLLLFGTSVAAVQGLLRTPVHAFAAGEVVATLATLSYAAGVAGGDWADRPTRLVVAVLAAAAGTAAVAALGRMRVALVGTSTVTALAWLALFSAGGLAELGAEPSLASVWGDLDGWPLLVAAALAGAVAVVRGVPLLLRVAAVNAAVLAVALVAVAPAVDEPTTDLVVAVLLATLALAGLVAWTPRPWAAGGLLALAVATVVNAMVGLTLATEATGRYLEVVAQGWTGRAGDRLPDLDQAPPVAEPWLLPLCALAVVLAVWVTARLSEPGRTLDVRRPLAVGAGATLLGLLAMTLLYPVPVWLVLALLLAAATATGVASVLRDDNRLAVATGLVGAAALLFSLYAELHTLVAALVLAALALAHHFRSTHPESAMLAGAVVPALTALAVWTTGALAEGRTTWVALTGILVLSVMALGRVKVPSGPVAAGTGVEVGAAFTAVPLAAAGLSDPGLTNAPTWLAVYLTVAGTAASLMALTRADRRWVGWLGGALLVLATWVRLWDLGIDEPEPYTLPSALALLVVGGVMLRRDPAYSTHRALGAGLALAVGPSLLWALDDPSSLRALLLGLACLGLVVAGAQLRWSAPLTYGAVAGLLLVLREAAPYVGDAVPRWALIGLAGALLIAMGVTWESRLRDARRVMGYVRGLR